MTTKGNVACDSLVKTLQMTLIQICDMDMKRREPLSKRWAVTSHGELRVSL